MEKLIGGLWIFFAGLFVGSVHIGEIYPFAAAFFAAVCMQRKNALAAYMGLVFAVAKDLYIGDILWSTCVFYSALLFALGLFLCGRLFDTKGSSELMMALATGGLVLFARLPYVYISGIGMSALMCIMEALLALGVSMIFSKAMHIILEDDMQIVVDNQAAIAVLLFGLSALAGMPYEVGVLSISPAFALLGVLFSLYRYGFGIGMTWTAISGWVLSYNTEIEYYAVCMLPTAFCAYAMLMVLRGRRAMFCTLYACVYWIFGNISFPLLLEETNIKALTTAVIIFLLLPVRYVTPADERMLNGELSDNSSEWGRLIIGRVKELSRAFGRIDYTLACSGVQNNYAIGFKDVGQIIDGFTSQLEKSVPMRKSLEARILDELLRLDIQVKSFNLIKNNDDRYELYLTARVRRGRIVMAERVVRIIEDNMRLRFELKPDSRRIIGKNYEMICMCQRPEYRCVTAVRRLSRYGDEVSGDNYLIEDIGGGQLLVVIADGMGNGERASVCSQLLIDSIEELLTAGFNKDMALRVVNMYLADKTKGECFSTLDMLLVDLHTGYARIYKAGAAPTFVKRREWIEVIKSTSLPMGVVDGAKCEQCKRKLYFGELVIMLSDGVLESIIYEDKEDYLRSLLMEADSDEPDEVAAQLIESIRAESGNRLKDDATLIVAKIVKSL